MSLLTLTLITGAECDVRGCTLRQELEPPAPTFSPAARSFEAALLRWGWARRCGRSVRWYCPGHADRARRCVKGRYGCSPWCPVHGHGSVQTWDTEDAKRLAGKRNMLTDADRGRQTTGGLT